MIEFVNSADQLSLGAVMTRHDRTVLRRTEWRSLAVIMITTDSLVDEETRQRSQMTCTRWDTTISYIGEKKKKQTKFLSWFFRSTNLTLVSYNQKRVDDDP